MKKVSLLPLVLLVAALGYSQEAGTESLVPFVSKLKAKAVETRIIITWHNPQNLQGSVLLYRHSAEIDGQNLQDADLIARLEADQESYQDNPLDDTPFYYAVLIEDSEGTIQQLFIPFRNKTSRGVGIAVVPTVESRAAQVSAIRTTIVDDAVQVDFQVANPNRNLLLFRSNSKLISTEDLIDAYAPLQLDAGTTRFIDYPIPGVETYYAVVDTELFKLGKQNLQSGQNSTDRPAVVPIEVERVALPPAFSEEGGAAGPGAAESSPVSPGSPSSPGTATAIRETTPAATTEAGVSRIVPSTEQTGLPATPLPYLQLERRFTGPQRIENLDPRTQAAVSRLLSSAPPAAATQTSVVILPEEKNGPKPSESASLQKIVMEQLLAGDYQGAESKLQGFLNLRRSPYTEARVRFYLGQAYYFQGLYEEALLEFVLAQGQLYAPVKPWLESCFRRLWNGQ